MVDAAARLHNSRLAGYLALAVGVTSVGFSAIFIRSAGAPGPVAAFYRMAIAALLMAWPFYRRIAALGSVPRAGLLFGLYGGLLLGLDNALWSTGVTLSGAINPTILVNTAPLWVGIGALIFFRERLRIGFWIGTAIALFGAAIILGLDSLRAFSVGLGSLLGLGAAVVFAASLLVAQRGRESLDALTYYWMATATAAVTVFGITLLLRQPLLNYPISTYLNLLGLALVPQVIGWLALTYALGLLPATVVSPSLLAQPVVTGLLAIPLLGENLSLAQIAGGATVLAGVYLVHRSRETEKE